MADSFVQVAPDSTGARMQTTTKTVNAQTVHRQVVSNASQRTRVGFYRVHTGVFLVQAAAHAATVGFWWLINPVGSTVAVSVKKVSFASQHGTALATPTSPRITLERVTFTGTASGAVVTPAKRVRTSVAGLTAEATNVASLRTASTGLTLTAGEVYKAFLPVFAVTATVATGPAGTDDYDPSLEDDELVLAAGEGIVCRQPDAGTTSDTRRCVFNVTWEEFTAP
jgi:hypothetical protein